MARFLVSFGLFSLVTNIALALMVTSDSPCMSLCSNGQGSDSIDGSEIVCQNNNFITTTAGRKLKSCLSCLQLSTASGNDQNDQYRFIYNIRYTLASCLYGFSNVTDTISTPCSTSKACGPLKPAIEDGNFITSNETAYGYCSVNYNSILSSGTSACISCLQAGNTESYLSNFLIALQAGCHQQPPDGTIIGLNDSVFSQYIIAETSPGKGYNTTVSSSSTSKKGLSKNTIIGISIGLCILLLITIFIIFILWRKSMSLKRQRNGHSSLDERYGALNITAPNEGAFGNPQSRFKTITLAAPPPARKRKNTNTTPLFNLSKYHSDDESFHKRDTNVFPTHQAYYPPHPHFKAEDMLPILPNDKFPSPYPYPYPPSSNEHSPISNPARYFSPPAYNLAQRLDRKEGATFHNRGNAQNKRMDRNVDRGRDVDVDVNSDRDITTSYARAAIDGTQSSGISVSSLSPDLGNNEMRLDSDAVKRTKSPSMGGENGGISEKERNTNTNANREWEKERGKKKKRAAKRMLLINDQDQDQDQDQWPGEF
ncbi:4bce7d26-6c51-44d3-9306-fb2451ef50d0 [Sclerotinia trifoliorum]|uniref:4bce7d26-6c51-44d3-9306-fb2451ef50d0 n=1 Tax=Sclerotinia trifoliorum TaxID=28548 RepID=A0A8H2VLE8_9HELO|nr:4bce7d26-6c51-44d3-9306-fb2451ef50d0 [Sclerotinia trifoliorum]